MLSKIGMAMSMAAENDRRDLGFLPGSCARCERAFPPSRCGVAVPLGETLVGRGLCPKVGAAGLRVGGNAGWLFNGPLRVGMEGDYATIAARSARLSLNAPSR